MVSTEIDTLEQQHTEKIETEVKDVNRIRKHTGVRNTFKVFSWGIPFTQYHILFPHCRKPPSEKETPRWTVRTGQPARSYTVSVSIRNTLEFSTRAPVNIVIHILQYHS